MDLGLADKVCVVTGSTGGHRSRGRAAPRRRRARTSSRPAAAASGIGDLHVAADLPSRGEPERLVAAALERFGRIDCLVNNVGGTEIRRFDELTDDDWQRSLAAQPDERRAGDRAPRCRRCASAARRDRERLLDRRRSARPPACPTTR